MIVRERTAPYTPLPILDFRCDSCGHESSVHKFWRGPIPRGGITCMGNLADGTPCRASIGFDGRTSIPDRPMGAVDPIDALAERTLMRAFVAWVRDHAWASAQHDETFSVQFSRGEYWIVGTAGTILSIRPNTNGFEFTEEKAQ